MTRLLLAIPAFLLCLVGGALLRTVVAGKEPTPPARRHAVKVDEEWMKGWENSRATAENEYQKVAGEMKDWDQRRKALVGKDDKRGEGTILGELERLKGSLDRNLALKDELELLEATEDALKAIEKEGQELNKGEKKGDFQDRIAWRVEYEKAKAAKETALSKYKNAAGELEKPPPPTSSPGRPLPKMEDSQ